MTGSPSEEFLFSSCFCHTWDGLGPGLRSHQASKCKDTIKGEKCCMHAQLGQLWGTRYKMIKPQLPLLRCWGQKQGSEYKPTHSTTRVGRPPKPAFCSPHGSTPPLTPHKGPACPPWDQARELVSLPSNCSKNSNETEAGPYGSLPHHVLSLPLSVEKI